MTTVLAPPLASSVDPMDAQQQSKTFLAGPPLAKVAKMASGEESDDEAPGGARLHAEVWGPGDVLATDGRVEVL